PNPLRSARSDLWEGHRGGIRCGDAARRDQKKDRLHVAEVFTLRRSEGGGEYRVFWWRLRRATRNTTLAPRLRPQDGRFGRQAVDDDAPALGRMEAAAGPRLRDLT